MTINVQAGDSPKIYALLRDIYANPLSIETAAISSFTYSVYKIASGVRVPVTGFVDVSIPAACYHSTPQPYPTNISGLTTAQIAAKYNVEVFPYQITTSTDNTQTWLSPFTETGSTYELVVRFSYLMTDSALSGTATINKCFSTRIFVKA